MSESEISDWRALQVDAKNAQLYRKAGLTTAQVSNWMNLGLNDSSAILAWTDAGWTSASAAPWLEKRFSLDAANAWSAEQFTAQQARNWVDADFKLSEAVENRAKGLTPVR